MAPLRAAQRKRAGAARMADAPVPRAVSGCAPGMIYNPVCVFGQVEIRQGHSDTCRRRRHLRLVVVVGG